MDVRWGSYSGFEGPYTHGTTKFVLPTDPDDDTKILAVLTTSEGGAFDAINGYDRCIMSGGLIQLCEAQYFLFSSLIGAIVEQDLGLVTPLLPALKASNATFEPVNGKWRFLVHGTPVTSVAAQQRLFLLNSNGLKGTFDQASKDHAILWTTCLSEMLAQEEATKVQTKHVAARLKSFAMKESKAILFDDPTPSEGWPGAMRAVFLSFAGNLPAVADTHLRAAIAGMPGVEKWSPEWCISIIRQMTFGPQIAIYPGRYNKIRPVVEKLYGVDLPDFASDLQAWRKTLAITPGAPSLETTEEVQEALLKLGYDLGPKGADGKMGSKTRDAIFAFQKSHGLGPDGQVGPKTRKALETELLALS